MELPRPEQAQIEIGLEQVEGALDVLAPGIERHDLGHGEPFRLAHIGEIGLGGAVTDKAHRPHEMLGLVAAVGAEPDQALDGFPILVMDMHHRVGGLVPRAGDPEVAQIAEGIEPGETEIAEIGEDERPARHISDGEGRPSRSAACWAGW